MKHYYGYDVNGELVSIETYGPCGFPATHRMEDPTCVEPSIVALRNRRSADTPALIGWLPYECPCPSDGTVPISECKCIGSRFSTHRVDLGTFSFLEKPARAVYLNDEQVTTHMQIVTAPPGTSLVLKVVSDVPDGTTVRCIQMGMVDLTLEDQWDLTFTNGETDTKILTAPAQGSRGLVALSGLNFRAISVVVRGFA